MADLEIFIVTTTNNFLIKEANSGRLSPEIVMRFQHEWKARGHLPVVEFLYDAATQFRLVMANYQTVKFAGEFRHNIYARDSAIQVWDLIVHDLSIHSFCRPDRLLQRHVYDLARVLEMLGAGHQTLDALKDLQLKTTRKIFDRKVLLAFRKQERGPLYVRAPQYGDDLYHKRDISVSSSSAEDFEGIEHVVANMPAPDFAAFLNGPGPTVRKHDRVGVLR